jgi:DNA-binding transcriptional regulator YhcF (GntR family)
VNAVPWNRKWPEAAGAVRAVIADGTLKPGDPAPSAAALGRATGFGKVTCRKALNTLIGNGILVPGTSLNGRARVAGPDPGAPAAGAARELCAALAARRHAAGLGQAGLASITGYSVTAIAHAETGRTWQARRFWKQADKALAADGELLSLYDAIRAGRIMTDPKHITAAGIVRAQIADGTLKPGDAAPSGMALARLTGFSPPTCRKALRRLVADGVLVPGPGPGTRPRIRNAPASEAGKDRMPGFDLPDERLKGACDAAALLYGAREALRIDDGMAVRLDALRSGIASALTVRGVLAEPPGDGGVAGLARPG